MDLALKIKLEKQENLLAGCIRGDRLYQKKLYEQFYGKMMAVCMRYTNNREEARDIFHEAFMKVFKNLNRYEPKSSLDSWIRRIMINTAIDHYRKNKKYRNEVNIDNASQSYTAFNHHIVEEMSAKEIVALVQELTPGYRAVFNLYVMEGYSHKEIAAELGISEGTSKSNLAKARGKLKEKIRILYPDRR